MIETHSAENVSSTVSIEMENIGESDDEEIINEVRRNTSTTNLVGAFLAERPRSSSMVTEDGTTDAMKLNTIYKNIIEKLKFIFIIINDAVTHTFVLSIFEGLFFWTYVSKREDQALRKQLGHLKEIISYVYHENGVDIRESVDLESIQNSVTLVNRTQENKKLYNWTILLSLILFLMMLGCSMLAAFIPNFSRYVREPVHNFQCRSILELKRTILNSFLPICIISIYEIAFFQFVVSVYIPITSEEIYLELLEPCLLE